MELKLLQRNVNKSVCSKEDYHANEIALFVDSETGIQYFVMNHEDVNCMCPRLGKDGKPMVLTK